MVRLKLTTVLPVIFLFVFNSSALQANPKLIVIISVDQLRRDRVTDDLPGALGMLSRQGRVFVDSELNHAITSTCPGHSVLVTGVTPGRAGIPGNTFVDQQTFQERYCVDDENNAHQVIDSDHNRSPVNLRASTFGDWLKDRYPQSRVFSVGGKDRAVITMGGHKADGVFWYNQSNGKFTSSGYYMKSLPGYIDKFNGTDPVVDGHLRDIPGTWVHPAGTYRQDDYDGESSLFDRSSGHPLKDGDGDTVFNRIYRSPVIDTQTIKLANIIIREESLGEGENPDLLLLALSATDTVGHLYGPRSSEAEATLDNVDNILNELIAGLEKKLGLGNVLVVLTADHGVAELPEYMTENGSNSCPSQGRLSFVPIIGQIYWSIYRDYTHPFDMPGELVKFTGQQLTLSREYLAENMLDPAQVLATLNEALTGINIVKRTWTQQQIRAGKGKVAALLRNSLTHDRSGDLTIQLHPDCVLTIGGGTTHGSVYDYDRNVPLIFYGWGVQAAKVSGTAHTIDTGPTLANHIGIAAPPDLDGKPLDLLSTSDENDR
ncbi:MAG: alkaline phosphatase family protein [bacterium]